jgi:hypothetical protein
VTDRVEIAFLAEYVAVIALGNSIIIIILFIIIIILNVPMAILVRAPPGIAPLAVCGTLAVLRVLAILAQTVKKQK